LSIHPGSSFEVSSFTSLYIASYASTSLICTSRYSVKMLYSPKLTGFDCIQIFATIVLSLSPSIYVLSDSPLCCCIMMMRDFTLPLLNTLCRLFCFL
jgi:hypothetical protein